MNSPIIFARLPDTRGVTYSSPAEAIAAGKAERERAVPLGDGGLDVESAQWSATEVVFKLRDGTALVVFAEEDTVSWRGTGDGPGPAAGGARQASVTLRIGDVEQRWDRDRLITACVGKRLQRLVGSGPRLLAYFAGFALDFSVLIDCQTSSSFLFWCLDE